MQKKIQGFQLSPQQKRLWLLQQNNHVYYAQCTIIIEGYLQVEILKSALSRVITQNEILRTNFHRPKGIKIPIQVINSSSILSFNIYNEEKDIELFLDEDRQRFVDLETDPSLHISLICVSPNRYIMLASLPAMNADKIALKNLVREISQCYTACLQGEELDEKPLQYADIAEWQNELLESNDTEAARDYWHKQDYSVLNTLELFSKKCSDENLEFAFQFQSFSIQPEFVIKIDELARQYNVSVSEFLFTCWQILLWRLTAQLEIIIGMACDGRQYDDLKEALGLFAKYLPIKCYLEDNYKFYDVVTQVKQFVSNAYTRQEYFTWEVIGESKKNNNQVRYLPFCFEFEEVPTKYHADDISFSIDNLYASIDRFNIKLSCLRQDDLIKAQFYYDTNLFLASDIQRLCEQFKTLLVSIINTPEIAVSHLEILSHAERQQLLVKFNNTKTDYPKDKCIHQLFEEQVDKTPDNIAVVFENQQLTYADLNTRTNQLAHYLQRRGVKREVLVGIYLERSLDMVIGLLGILKAGGAYVPLDPSYPQERLAFILEDAQVSVLLTLKKLVPKLAENDVDVIYLDRDWGVILQEIDKNLVSCVIPLNLAYVIYTSGSTGKPKGTMIPHQGLVNYLSWCQKSYALADGCGAPVNSSISFDATITSFFSPLLVGKKVVLLPEENEIESLSTVLRSTSNFSLVKITPAHLQILNHLLPSNEIAGQTRALIIGGEALLGKNLTVWRNQAPDTRIINEYGPTETVVGCCVYEVSTETSLSGAVPIGRPIANTQLYILNKDLQPTLIGVPGELYIGGDGLARGYLNRPELTAEKFIPNPFSEQLGTCLYKTGDLVRYLPKGEIEYIGRIDHQVKVRGFRIELGEIEALLSQHPAVRETVVVVREDSADSQRLVAYVVPQKNKTLTMTELRRFLESKLPNYMMPAAFVIIEALPLTPNGKIDRKTLPTPEVIQLLLKSDFVAPSTPIEEMLAGIWVEVLGIEKVGVHNNFFTLGGHSLLATRVISKVLQVFQLDMPLRRLFEQPTIAGLAKDIEKATIAGLGLETANIGRISRSQELPLSFAQQRLWFLAQLEPNSPFYNVPAAVRLQGQLNQKALQQSFKEILRRHETLRTNFHTIQGQPVAVISSTKPLLLPVLDLSELPLNQQQAQVRQQLDFEAQQPFDLNSDLLLRVKLLRLGQQEHIVLLTMHHIASDGWSIGVLVREVTALYEAFCAEKPSPLPELPIQYADFAVWQRQRLEGEALEVQIAYWKKQLGSNLPVLQLPTTRPRTEVKTNKGATQSFIIPSNLSQGLQMLSRQESVTLFMTLLAGFQILLQRYTNQDDIVVGTDVANRNRAEVEPLIGFFVNLLVLRADLSANPTFGELLKRVREVTLGAYAHQDLPFDQLVKALQPERNLSNTPPLFQVLFVLQNAPMPPLELPDLTLSILEVENEIAKFDIALFLTETEQGLLGKWQYNCDLFDATTITCMTDNFHTLLNSIVSQPNARIGNLEMLTDGEREQQGLQKRERKAFKREKFISVAPKAVSQSQQSLIKTDYLESGQTFPLVIQPNTDEIDFVAWAKTNRGFIETELLKHGAVLFRGFHIDSVSEFESVTQAICPDLFGEYGDLPRAGESGKVYSSTPYPPDKAILFHNESSHLHQFPLKIWFFCVQPAKQGGETPIVDCRKAYQLINLNLRERLAEKQLMYTRHYTDGLDVSWQDFFRTNDKYEVENYCIQAGIDFEWYDNNSLVTRQIRPAVAVHPKSGAQVFFNQIQLHHIAYLDAEVRKSLLSLFGDNKLPRNVSYGDGTPIEDEVIVEINAVYQHSKTSFPWQKGDILMIDNMLAAHGRYPYEGQRKIVVAMGEMIQSRDITLHGR